MAEPYNVLFLHRQFRALHHERKRTECLITASAFSHHCRCVRSIN
jgi:hypothetical protein